MEKIYEPNDSFDFSKLSLLSPSSMPGGNYFIKFRINDYPLYIQPPKCVSKSSIFKSGKKHYCDLMFTNENEDFIRWMENLENYCQNKIFDHRSKWFETELDEHDIENSFTSPLKLFKSGKYYISRTNVPTMLGKCSLKIYNEDEQEVDIETIKENTNIITILEIQGIKCSSKNFQIEIEIKQMMVFKQNNLFEKCIFTQNNPRTEGFTDKIMEQSTTKVVESGVHRTPTLECEALREKLCFSDQTLPGATRPSELVVESGVHRTPTLECEALREKLCFSDHGNNNNNNNNPIVSEADSETNVESSATKVSEEDVVHDAEIFISDDSANATTPIFIPDPNNGLSPQLIEDFLDSETNDTILSDSANATTSLNPLFITKQTNLTTKETYSDSKDILEVDMNIDDLSNNDTVYIKKRNDIYYQMYKEAKRKAKMARDLAISSYLEAKHIKNTYMLENEDSDSDFDEESFDNME